jgi:hypothetical protein
MKAIEYYYACTNNKIINLFDDTNRLISFFSDGKLLYEGKYEHLKINNCDFFIIDTNTIFAVNNDVNSVLFLNQYNKYTYCYTSQIFGSKRKLIKNKNNSISFLITLFDSSSYNKQIIPGIGNFPIYFIDYYNKNKINNSFYPKKFCKKTSILNLAISKIIEDKIVIIDSNNNIDLKFLSECLFLEKNCLLVPNILHLNNELLPFSLSKELFNGINRLNDNISNKKIIHFAIINAFLKGYYIKTYPAVISGKRIRGDFDNISETEKNDILKNFKDNFIFKKDDFKIYETELISDSFICLR